MERFTFATQDAKLVGRTLSGTVHAYGTVTTDGRKVKFAPGAFRQSIASGKVASFAHHDPAMPIASQAAGNLRLSDSPQRLSFELVLPTGITYAEDLRQQVATGLLSGMSFAIGRPVAEQQLSGGVRFITQAPLLSIDPVSMPAFEGSSVALHSARRRSARSQAVKLRHAAQNRQGSLVARSQLIKLRHGASIGQSFSAPFFKSKAGRR